jgi:hypothetical protein
VTVPRTMYRRPTARPVPLTRRPAARPGGRGRAAGQRRPQRPRELRGRQAHHREPAAFAGPRAGHRRRHALTAFFLPPPAPASVAEEALELLRSGRPDAVALALEPLPETIREARGAAVRTGLVAGADAAGGEVTAALDGLRGSRDPARETEEP